MLQNRLDAAASVPPPCDALLASVASRIPAHRLITDPPRLLTWGTDASFYRLVPKLAVVVESEEEVIFLLAECARLETPVTFRAAGTSLSGQAITDSVLVLLGDQWRRCEVGADAATIALQPSAFGAEEQAGFPYRSIIQLVETCASEVAARGGVHEGAS
jgi:D-lactate dehydrogenase